MIKEKLHITRESVGQVGACSLGIINNKTQLKTTHRSASQNGNRIFLLEVSSKQTGNIKRDIDGLSKEKGSVHDKNHRHVQQRRARKNRSSASAQ
jgi:hypothetical protein